MRHTSEPQRRQPQPSRGSETGLYFMPISGRFTVAVMVLQAIKTGCLALAILTLLAQRAGDSGPRYLPIDSRIWIPCAAGLLLLAAATGWLAFKITRRSRHARRLALFTTGIFLAGDLLVLILAVTNVADYQLGLLGSLGAVADLVAFALLWSNPLRTWCDR